MTGLDAGGLLLTVAFIVFGLSLIPLDRWLNERRDARRRNMAHRKRPSFAKWYRR